jgi:SAM-dependent methyltransferase
MQITGWLVNDARSRVDRQRRVWSARSARWNHDDNPGLAKVVDAVLDEAGDLGGKVVADLGAGSGQLALIAALTAAKVVAVDVSPAMLGHIDERASGLGLANVETVNVPLQDLDFPAGSFDVVVSNYALHHLDHVEKVRLLGAIRRSLRPGGRLVIGDMMMGLGRDERDREIIGSKVAALVRRGPGGWWRLVKAAWRLARRDECPESPGSWQAMLESAGFLEVERRPVVSEAVVMSAVAPASPGWGSNPGGRSRPVASPA